MKKLSIILVLGISMLSFSQKEQHVLTFNDFTVLKDATSNTYKILNKNNEIIQQELKYVNYVEYSNTLQVLDNKENIIYLNQDLDKVSQPGKVTMGFCGTVAYFKMKIIENDQHYLIEYTEDKSVYGEGIKKSIIDTIIKKDIKEIYFVNSKREIDYDENFYFPTYLIIDYGIKFGIKDEDSLEYYDSIDLKNPYAIKVGKNNRYGYYGITEEVKYKKLDGFKYNLAKFVNEDGKQGYIDLKGNEY